MLYNSQHKVNFKEGREEIMTEDEKSQERDSAITFNTNTVLVNALASSVAGIVSRTVTHPLDTAKARLQAPAAPSSSALPLLRGPLHALQQTFLREGIRGLYRGYGTVIVGGTPGTMLYLCSYDLCKQQLSTSGWLSPPDQSQSFGIHFISGLVAETIACTVYVPVDVVKERLQVQERTGSYFYKGTVDALVQISRNEGLRGIYKGYAATLGSFGPFSALYFVFYEEFQSWAKQYTDTDTSSTLDFPWQVATSAGAGAIASFLTSPLDMAKLRLQVQRGALAQGKQAQQSPSTNVRLYRGVFDCLASTYEVNGLRGLFRGAGARMLHFAPATTVTMTCYEKCRAMIQEHTWVGASSS